MRQKVRIDELVALVFASAFLGGCLVILFALVPGWHAMSPSEFLGWFSANGPRLGATLFPVELAAIIFTLSALLGAMREKSPARFSWAISAVCIIGTALLLPVYFASANTALTGLTIALPDVADEISNWEFWQAIRTTMSAAAVISAGVAIKQRVASS